MQTLTQDIRYALRQLRRAPGFAATAVLTLALTVGLAATVFSVSYALVIEPLPWGQPERIVQLQPFSPSGYTQPASWPEYEYWRAQNHTLSALAGYSSQTMNFRGPSGPAAINAVHTTDNFFDALGVHALLGRTFLPGENAHGRNDVAVLSYSLWQKNFNGRPDVIGAKVDLDGLPVTVIGVMPSGFNFPLGSQDTAYAPFRFPGAIADVTSGSHFMRTIGRLRPSATVESAGADMNRIMSDYARIDPASKGRKMQVQAIATALLGDTRALLRLLLLAVLAILVLGCSNIAGLMLVQGIRREREIALRSAIGASAARMVRQLAAEIVLLAIAGTCGGGAAAWAFLHATRSLLTASLARGAEVALSPVVLLASLCAALVTLLVAGLLPARQLFSVSPLAALRSGSAATGTSRGQRRLGAIFIGTQIALAMVLLLTSGLLLQSLLALRTTDLLFPIDHLLTEDVNLSPGSIAGRNLMQTFYTPLLEQVRAIPGVRSAAIINMLPVQDYGFNSDVQIVGQPPAPRDREVLAELRFVSPSYYQTISAKLLRGRLLDDRLDTAGSQSVIVVNQAFVRKFFRPGQDPIGRQIMDLNHATIVGVVSDQRQSLYRPPLAEMDFAANQLPADAQREILQEMQLVVRTSVDPPTIAKPLMQVMQGLDPGLPFRPALTMEDILSESLVTQRMEGWLFGAFATLAVLLALLGLYGLIAQQVEQSRRETGVRMALGAQRWNVLLHWMGRVAGISLTGLAAGLALSFALHKIIASVLSVQGKNEAAIAAMLMGLMEIFALAAALIPARRAASIEPMQALRAE